MKLLAFDLFCGLGGWSDGLLAEGWEVIGFDIERQVYGEQRYPAQLVLQDVLTIHGSQFRDASLIVASPPCQEYSYMAMPWSLAKEKASKLRAGPPEDRARLTALFDACFRIQREASEAARRHIPLVVENVRGAQPWVGRSRWNFGSFHLWGDVPALMPMTKKLKVPGFRFDGKGGSFQTASVEHTKVGGIDFNGYGTPGYKAQAFNSTAEKRLREAGAIAVPCEYAHTSRTRKCGRPSIGKFECLGGKLLSLCARHVEVVKQIDASWEASPPDGAAIAPDTTSGKGRNPDGRKVPSEKGRRTDIGKGARFTSRDCGLEAEGVSRKSPARKAASAMIAKIPLPLSRHIAAVYQSEMA